MLSFFPLLFLFLPPFLPLSFLPLSFLSLPPLPFLFFPYSFPPFPSLPPPPPPYHAADHVAGLARAGGRAGGSEAAHTQARTCRAAHAAFGGSGRHTVSAASWSRTGAETRECRGQGRLPQHRLRVVFPSCLSEGLPAERDLVKEFSGGRCGASWEDDGIQVMALCPMRDCP